MCSKGGASVLIVSAQVQYIIQHREQDASEKLNTGKKIKDIARIIIKTGDEETRITRVRQESYTEYQTRS